ncbi:hypothetical protein FK220_016910 [Flavobacteriaceae bacterium TP-CH-4]|uniref:FAS1 domain-containing protein n=1 Tax=Pelagihabitans pacificus TaxID=2696054 RepID=A0A967E7W0_9FLAO|nr:fasciclin domain-containing protein [Pelagihabitans pacificus]NHF61035.1 hypothetical protein [Pelagihabitans pacificus]
MSISLPINSLKRFVAYVWIFTSILFASCYETGKKEYKSAFEKEVNNEADNKTSIPVNMALGNLHTITDIVERNPEFHSFKKALGSTAMLDSITAQKKVTLFAPIDGPLIYNDSVSISQRDMETTNFLRKKWVLNYIVNGQLDIADIKSLLAKENELIQLPTVGKSILTLVQENGIIHVKDGLNLEYDLVIANQSAKNGIVHGLQYRGTK